MGRYGSNGMGREHIRDRQGMKSGWGYNGRGNAMRKSVGGRLVRDWLGCSPACEVGLFLHDILVLGKY